MDISVGIQKTLSTSRIPCESSSVSDDPGILSSTSTSASVVSVGVDMDLFNVDMLALCSDNQYMR